jgi:predicted kinase
LPAVQRRVAERLLDGIARWFVSQPEATQAALAWPALRRWVEAECSALAPLFDARLRAGRVRECHGDLHLANLNQLGDEPTAFDAIEFDPELRWIDVVEDIAFVVMDLIAHRESGLAFRFLDTWLADSGDYDGLPVLRYHLVGRALVRALVASIAQAQGRASAPGLGAADYLGLAIRLAEAGEPRLAITHGLPGSGKSFVSQRLLEAAGAIRVRADVERKRMHGLAALESSQARVPGGIYDASTTQRTYARLHEVARSALRAGWPVIVDAAFLRSDERAEFAALAKALGVPFAILDCAAPLPVLRERLVARQAGGGDASEADLAVLELLRSAGEPLSEPEAALALRIDAGAAIDAAALDRRWKGGSAFALGQAARPTPAAQ